MSAAWGITAVTVHSIHRQIFLILHGLARVLKNLILLLVSVFVSALITEAMVRVAGFAPRTLEANRFFVDGVNTTWSVPDQELGWINKEGRSISIEAGKEPMTFWSYGRRASRGKEAQPIGSDISIMISGGSNAQSYGVTDAQSFPYQLAQRYPNVRFENFGNGGYSTAQALLLAQRAMDQFYESPPNLIILTFADSHVARNVSDQSWVYSISDSQGRYVSPPHYRLGGDELQFEPFRTIEPWPLETSSALVTVLHNIWLQSVAFNTASEGVAVTRQIMSQFAEFADQHNSDFIVAILEDYSEISDTVFEDAGFPVLNCSGFERTSPQDYLLGGGGHPNSKLHDHFTDCIEEWLGPYVAQAVEVERR